jgi:ribonuclease J
LVRLTFYGGVNEIGGNKVLIEDKKTRIFLDFGQSFNFGSKYFTGWLTPRAITGLKDHFEFGLLPKIRGIYAERQLTYTDLPHTKPKIDAVFLSHAHFDHVAHVCFLNPEIPVYLGVGTRLFMESMEDTSNFCDYGSHKYQTFRTGQKIKLDDITVEPVHVDHSIPAAYGFIIHTSEGSIVYTGDLRIHGPRKDLTEDFLEKAADCEPAVMICEGTRMVENEKRKNYSEAQVKQLGNKIVSSTDKIVFIMRYSRDIDRFRTFYNVAKNNNRKIVISPKTAYLLTKLLNDERLNLPNPLKDENIIVYYKRKKSGEFDEGDYFLWERQFMDKIVTYQFVHKNQSKLIMDLDLYQFTELIDIRPNEGSPFIHSMSEPFSEEDIQDEVMHNWLCHFSMHFHQLHASGHMNKKQIADLINYVKPKKLFPIHTENQEMFKNIGSNVQTIKYGEKYIL